MDSTNSKLPSIAQLFLVATVLAVTAVTKGSTISRVYLEAYKELNAGQTPDWKGMDDVERWLHADETRIEPLVLKWLEAGPGTDAWKRAMMLARKVPTAGIRDAVWDVMRDKFDRAIRESERLSEEDHRAVAGPIAVLSAGADQRATPLVNRLSQSRTCPSGLVEEYLKALRKLGDAESLSAIREINGRPHSAHIAREAALTEKVLVARVAGHDILQNAEGELRKLTQDWLKALEAQDKQAYLDLLPYGARGGVSDYDFRVELLGSLELPKILEAVKKTAGQEVFEIDRDNLEASMVVDGRYKFLYVLEVDGWKVAGPTQIAP